MNARQAITLSWVASLLIALVFLLAGCTGTPRGNYSQLQDGYIGVVQSLVDLRNAGQIEETTWQEDILPWINTGDAFLDVIDDATAIGDAPPILATERVADSLAALRRILLRLEVGNE